MLKELNFVVPGKPVPKGRPRLGKGHVYTPKKTKDYEKKVAMVALQARQICGLKKLTGPVEVLMTVLDGVCCRLDERGGDVVDGFLFEFELARDGLNELV